MKIKKRQPQQKVTIAGARSTFMTKGIRFCPSADEALALPGADVIAINLAATVAVMLASRSCLSLIVAFTVRLTAIAVF